MVGVLLAIAVMAGLWLPWSWEPEWQTSAILRAPGDTWPLAFSPDSRSFVTFGGESLTLWDVATGQMRATWKLPDGHAAPVGAFAPDGRTFASLHSAYPGPIGVDLIDVETGRVRVTLPTTHSQIYAVRFADEGRTLRVFLGDGNNLSQVISWDIATGRETTSRPLDCRTMGSAITISPDGHRMALAAFGGKTIRIWDLDADRECGRLVHPSSELELAPGLAFSRDSRTLIAGREDGSFEFWDLAKMTLRTTIPGHRGGYESFGIELAPDGLSLASRGEFQRPDSILGGLWLMGVRGIRGPGWKPDSEVIVVDLETGRRLARAKSAMHPHYSPDGSTIATRQTDFSVRLRPAPGGGH